jgi:predicted nucleotidyltransferase component of viral defense system
MLEPRELADVADQFGVAEHQVRRDHLISHVLAAIGTRGLPVTFFGGTALCRTFIVDPADGARLSEDIDLYTEERAEVARSLDGELPRLLRREFPGIAMSPQLASVRAVEPALLHASDGLQVRIQVLDCHRGHHDLLRYPTEVRPVVLRYQDLPAEVSLRTPTLSAFAAMKTVAWRDRHTARDLYDLAALASIDGLTVEAAELVRDVYGVRVAPHDFADRRDLAWHEQLAHQTRLVATPQECLRGVLSAYRRTLGWEGADEV